MTQKMEKYLCKSLKQFCTFKIGGNAKWVFVVHSLRQLKQSVAWCMQNNTKFKVIGFGANLLFDDAGFDGAIIVNKANNIKIFGQKIVAASGTSVAELINRVKQKSLSGLEFFAGIPSTLGGALTNNLGAWGQDIANLVVWVKGFYIDTANINSQMQTPGVTSHNAKGTQIPTQIAINNANNDLNSSLSNGKNKKIKFKTIKLKQNLCGFEYRNSLFKTKQNFIITKAKLCLNHQSKATIQANLTAALNKKAATQPIDKPSAGSVFKRTHIMPAKLIDECGLKGKTIGKAQISTKHAGFIVNLGNATSQDVKTLIKQIEDKIYSKYGIPLEREIEFVQK